MWPCPSLYRLLERDVFSLLVTRFQPMRIIRWYSDDITNCCFFMLIVTTTRSSCVYMSDWGTRATQLLLLFTPNTTLSRWSHGWQLSTAKSVRQFYSFIFATTEIYNLADDVKLDVCYSILRFYRYSVHIHSLNNGFIVTLQTISATSAITNRSTRAVNSALKYLSVRSLTWLRLKVTAGNSVSNVQNVVLLRLTSRQWLSYCGIHCTCSKSSCLICADLSIQILRVCQIYSVCYTALYSQYFAHISMRIAQHIRS